MEKITLGEVVKPQGIKGELKLRMLADDFNLVLKSKSLTLKGIDVTIDKARENDGFMYIKFNEINSVEEAEKLRGAKLETPKSEIELEEDEYFLEDLIGKMVVFENDEVLGEVTDIQNFGSADVFYVKKTNGKEVLFSRAPGVIVRVEEKIIVNKKRFDEVSV